MKKVKVCRRCSNFDIDEIKQFAYENKIKLKFGCIKQCLQNHPDSNGHFVGLIDSELFITSSKDDFFKKMK